ncbi:hypothetical protein Vafri_7765 [Volvox africanus]|uniref:Uncharacterized protein n=1 Tax=Volvox africanus TaxID=51714 RepID=A0A8J4B0X6_9CHLO|nr:hypothetical protein Vafri_7765 [Volvox africanus]
MLQAAVVVMLLAASFAVSQDLPLDLQRPLDGLHRQEGSALRAIKDWIKHLFSMPTNSTKESLVLPDTDVCNYTICCSIRTTISLARREEESAAVLKENGPPALLVCGSKGNGTAAVTVPCHAPIGSQPLLQAVMTRFRLMLQCRKNRQLDSRSLVPGSASFWGLLLPSAVREEYKPDQENVAGAKAISPEDFHRNGPAIIASENPGAMQSPMLQDDEATPIQPPMLQDDKAGLREAISIMVKALHSFEDETEAEQLHEVFNAAALMVGLQGEAGHAAKAGKEAHETLPEDDELINIMQQLEHKARPMEDSMDGEPALEQEQPKNITQHMGHEAPLAEGGMGPDHVESSTYTDKLMFVDDRTGAVSSLEAEANGGPEERAPYAIPQTDRLRGLAGQRIKMEMIAVDIAVRQWVAPRLVMVMMAIAAVAVIIAILMSSHASQVDRRMLRLRVAGKKNARAHEQLHDQHDALVSMLVSTLAANRELRDEMDYLRSSIKQQRISLLAAAHQAVMTASTSSATAVDLVQRAAKLQQAQGMLAGALSTAVQEWRKRGEMFAASLSFCRRRVEVMVRTAAVDKAAAAKAGRKHEEEVKHVFKELAVERQRHSITNTQAQAYKVRCRRMLRDLRGNLVHNMKAWTDLQKQLLSLHEMRNMLFSLVNQYQGYVAKLQRQVASQDDCCGLLHSKDATINGLVLELSNTASALENQRQQSAELQRFLAKADEDLSDAHVKVMQLEMQLQEAQAAAKISEARTESLSSINACLEQENVYLAPARARAIELQQQMRILRNAKAEHEAKISESNAMLQEIQREAIEKDRIIAELTMQLDDDKRQIQMMQDELQRHKEEGKLFGTVALPSKQSLMIAEQTEHCDRDQLVQALLAQLYRQWQPLPVDRGPAQAIAAEAAAVIVASTLDRGSDLH